MNPTTYSRFIQTAKSYANQGEAQRLNLMMLLLDTEARKSLWQANPGEIRTWDALLREEGLCTPTLFYDFKRAVKVVDVKVFGVYASAAIIKLKVNYRRRVLAATQEWIDAHKIRPTYQRISKYVATMKREMGIGPTPKKPIHELRLENTRLKRDLGRSERYCTTLKTTLKTNNIRIPKEPTA